MNDKIKAALTAKHNAIVKQKEKDAEEQQATAHGKRPQCAEALGPFHW
jgi:hypothetical protein